MHFSRFIPLLGLSFLLFTCSNDDDGLPGIGNPGTGGGSIEEIPDERGGAPGAWLENNEQMLLFGGSPPFQNDTWLLSGSVGTETWIDVSALTAKFPEGRSMHSMVTGDDDNVYLFAGLPLTTPLNDTWRYSGNENQWSRLPDGGGFPSPRYGHAATYIPSTGEMLVYGGVRGGGLAEDDFFNDTYLLNLEFNNWQRQNTEGPGRRFGSIAFYSSATDAVYLWGGRRVGEYPNDLWRFDLSNNEWSPIETTGDLPSGRQAPAWFWNDDTQELYIALGLTSEGTFNTFIGDAYILDLDELRWEAVSGKLPPDRWFPGVAFRAEDNIGYLFGGWDDINNESALNDTWQFDFENRTWTEMDPR